MKKLLSLVFSATTLWVVGLLALSVLIWVVGPEVSVREWRPLEDSQPRWLLIGALFGLLLLRLLWRAWRTRRANGAVVRQLLTPPPRAPANEEPAEAELLRQRFDAALKTLRHARFEAPRGLWGQLSARVGKRYLYELPWYTIIGSPGAGKTTALRNSGLRFPLAGALGPDGQRALTGVAGTRHIEWWFTDEAVLIDTAGRYVSQDSDPAADRQAWSAFLALLKKSRPRLPLNGVLVTVSVPELLGHGAVERAQQAASLRSRVQELHQQLGVRFPIYLMVSKCDLLAGFMDTLGNADRDTRAAPWGFSFDLDARLRSDTRTLGREFDALAQRLVDGLPERLRGERDLARRARIYSFPQQFGALRERLHEFVDTVFSPSQFEAHPMLRGVYFVSGTQEGTPLDRVLGNVARQHGLERALLPPNLASGKSFFLERLLRELVFAESELGGTDLAWERRRGWLAAAGYAGIATVSMLTLGAWSLSYARNRAYVDAVAAHVERVSEALPGQNSPAASDLLALLPALRATQTLAAGEGQDDAGWSPGLGLGQRDKLDAAAQQAYRQTLTQAFLPGLLARLEVQLAQNADKPELEYETLKAYVMLHDLRHFKAGVLQDFFNRDWDASLPASATLAQRADLKEHLAALLASGGARAATPEDKALLQRVRGALAAAPLAQRVYSRMQRQGVGAGIADFSIAKAVGPSAGIAFKRLSGKPLTEGVPGLYTYEGYHQAFQKQVEETTRHLGEEEGWVLGVQDALRDDKRFDAAQVQRLGDAARKLYLADYATTWRGYIADIGLQPMRELDNAVAMARLLGGTDSPLKPLMQALARQTTLDAPASGSWIDKGRQRAGQALGQATAGLGQGAARLDGSSPGAAIESLVDDQFVALRAQVQGSGEDGKGPAPIDKTIALIGELHAALSAAQQALLNKLPVPPIKLPVSEIEKLPEPLGALVKALAKSGIGLVNGEGSKQTMEDLRADVGKFCRDAIAGRYPVVRGSTQDIRPQDFAKLFSPGGLMDKFFDTHLKAIVDTSKRPWVTHLVEGQKAPIDAGTLTQFQRAAAIRDTFFPAGSALPALRLQLSPASMDGSILNFILDVDGQIVRYAHGPAIPVAVQWPGPQNSEQVRLQLTPPSASGPSGLTTQGPWALHRLFDTVHLSGGDDSAHFRVAFDVAGRKAEFEVTASSVYNPFRLRELNEFACPGGG